MLKEILYSFVDLVKLKFEFKLDFDLEVLDNYFDCRILTGFICNGLYHD